jgi:hypothetical protein
MNIQLFLRFFAYATISPDGLGEVAFSQLVRYKARMAWVPTEYSRYRIPLGFENTKWIFEKWIRTNIDIRFLSQRSRQQ